LLNVIEEATILVGGLGTRLRSVVKDIPKPLADVGGKPFLWYLIKKLLQEDVKRIVLAAGYRADLVERFVSEFFANENIEVVVESEPLGTGGALRFSMEFVNKDYFFLLNGDSFLDVDLREFEADSFSIGEFEISTALCKVENTERFGIVEIDEYFRVTRFSEKGLDRDKNYINGGVYILKKYVLEDYLRNFPDKFSFENDVLQKLDLQIIGIPYKVDFIDIGSPEDFIKAFTVIIGKHTKSSGELVD
jgi:D-glycero-alpha-D-manno-heptose 1-phosphate guanylyltransferase